ncbi:RNA polymerase sigma factor [soil metagenome]
MLNFSTDALAFKAFMQQHQQQVFNAVLNMMQQVQDAEDITQEVFVDAFQKHKSFRGESSVSTWLYRIAMNKCIDLLRQKERQRKWKQLGSFFGAVNKTTDGPADFAHPGTITENREKAVMFYQALQKLPVKQRTAYVLSETEHLSYKEISEVMKITIPAVESILFRARKNLRKILADFYTD